MARRKKEQPPQAAPAGFSQSDVAIWHTIDINRALDAGTVHERPSPATTIRLEGDEKVLAQGPFQLLEHRAPGDGTYVHDAGMFYATGLAGSLTTIGVAAARASKNKRARQQAAANAVPRWMTIGSPVVGHHAPGVVPGAVQALPVGLDLLHQRAARRAGSVELHRRHHRRPIDQLDPRLGLGRVMLHAVVTRVESAASADVVEGVDPVGLARASARRRPPAARPGVTRARPRTTAALRPPRPLSTRRARSSLDPIQESSDPFLALLESFVV